MERDSRDDGLSFDAIFVGGKPIKRALLRRTWTKLAKDCYKRGCNCNNCNLIPKDKLDSLNKCQVKYYVMGYIQLGYYPQKNNKEHINEE